MRVDPAVLTEAVRVLLAASSLGRRRALRVLLERYPDAAALAGRARLDRAIQAQQRRAS